MSPFARITRLHVIIIVVVLTLLVVGGEWYFLIKPQQEAFDAAKARYDAAYPGGTPDKMAAAQANLKKAKQQVAEAEATWKVYDRQLMPDIDLSKGPILASEQL